MSSIVLIAAGILIAGALDVYFVHRWNSNPKSGETAASEEAQPESPQALPKRAFGPKLVGRLWQSARLRLGRGTPLRRQALTCAVELALIALWVLVVGHAYLDMNPRMFPTGIEFGSTVQANFFWIQIQKCGLCAAWNGFENGGYPLFADLQGSMLHPIVAVTTLIWGVVNGAKATLLASFFLAGVAQWWIAWELRLGWLPRVWSAVIVVAAGHLAGRMDAGVVGVVLSTSMASLLLAGVLHLGRAGGRRAAVLVGILLASAILAGQGYMQIGLLGVLPAASVFLFDEHGKINSLWRYFLLASVLGLTLAAPFLLPFLHFSPHIAKDMDSEFTAAQPLAFLPLNLVIDEAKYYNSEILGKVAFPYLYSLFIGWIPVTLAIVGLSKHRRRDLRAVWFLASVAMLAFLMGSAVLPKAIAAFWPPVAGIRQVPLMAGLAVPMIMGLAACGLDRVIRWIKGWTGLTARYPRPPDRARWSVPLQWLLIIPLVSSVYSVYAFSQLWIGTTFVHDQVYRILGALRTNSLQWVEPPFGDHFFIEPGIEMGLKLSPAFMTWRWKDREAPNAFLYEVRGGPHEGPSELVGRVEDVSLYAVDAPYASVVSKSSSVPCTASGAGGDITVTCEGGEPGKLIVKENMWSGWYGWMDGTPATLGNSRWLEVDAPAGNHTFAFRYLPWDVPLGIAISLIGILLCILMWRRSAETAGLPLSLRTPA